MFGLRFELGSNAGEWERNHIKNWTLHLLSKKIVSRLFYMVWCIWYITTTTKRADEILETAWR